MTHPSETHRPVARLAARLLPAAALLSVLLALLGVDLAEAATGLLENPGELSSQSGIGVISGWVCDADVVTVTIDGTQVLEAAYGTPRGDTQGACGDTDNGFGLLWNFNHFGDGAHTIVAAADGVEFGAATFTVATLGAAFETGFSGSFAFAGFPNAGSSLTLLWQTSAQNFVIVPPGTEANAGARAAAASSAASSGGGSGDRVEAPAAATGMLENPGSFVSGIWLFSGWVCAANQVTLVVDGTHTLVAAYGTPRGDTVGACGDTNNGFGLLWNFNLFEPGEHTVEAFADGMKFGEADFLVTGFGTQFLRNESGSFRVDGFPGPLEDTFVKWSEGAQNFIIFAKSATGAPTPTPGPIPTPSPKPSPTASGATPTPGPTPIGGTPTPQPTPTKTPTPTPGGGLCGNGVVDPGEQCDGQNLNGFTCDSAYLIFDVQGVTECQGEPLACDSDCTFNAENSDACVCSCEEDVDCGFPDDPEGVEPPVGVDCTLLWCNKGACPCDHLADEDTYLDCLDNIFDTLPDTNPVYIACENFSSCVDDVGCFIASDSNQFYSFSTLAGICGESSNGVCDTNPDIYLETEAARRALCTSFDVDDAHRCAGYCDDAECDCSNPNNLLPYDPIEGSCS
jgi:hypothetical protein